MKSILFAISIAVAPLSAAEPLMDVFVSTGDNHFLGSSLPIDSPASIEATFDLFQHVNHARRVYWRGLEEACWVSTMIARPENCRYDSLWQWFLELYRDVHPDQLAVKAAHDRGMEIWGMGSLWDWGSPADTPGFGDYPFCYESKLKLQHPEWAAQDKHGVRRQGGPIELAYPAARKALVDLIVQETLKAGYDGIAFLTYVENYSARFADEFGYSDPIVADFKTQYKLDLRTEPFKRGASREDWMRLRGSYVTAFLRELKAALEPHKIKLGMVVDPNNPRQPQSWNVPELMITAGSHHMDVDTWVREGITDELIIYGNNSGQSQIKTLDDLQFLARGTKTSVSVLTSGPFREGWKSYQDKGMPTILAVSDDAQHLARGFIPEQKGIASSDVYERMRGLQQVVEGTLKLEPAALLPGLASKNLIERRLTLQALGKLPGPDIAPLAAALNDPENGVRCSAALALADKKNPAACGALLQAVRQHGNHMLRECTIIALRRMTPPPIAELQEAMKSPVKEVREVAMRTLLIHASNALVPTFQSALGDDHRFVRFVAAEALGNCFKSQEAIQALLGALHHKDQAVVARAAVSLGNITKLHRPENEASKGAIVSALRAAFESTPDDGWSFRPIGNALLDCGPDGVAVLRELRDHSTNAQLADHAWRVVDLTQRPNTFSAVTPEQNEEAMKRRPAHGRDIHVGTDAPTIDAAIKMAQPGDTIHLQPIVYREYAGFYGKKGERGKPITLDGHGATLEGSDPLDPAAWTEESPGLFKNDNLLRLDDAVIGRWFFVWGGKMNHMGRTSKGKSAPLKPVNELQPGEWTFIKDPSREKPPSKQIYGTFYVKLPPGQKLSDANIRAPVRSAGVQMAGDNAWLVIKNLTATHPYNDGFNIHGDCRDVVFENIRAIECGDDGISAHETAQYHVDGFVSIGNSTGITDTVAAQTSYNRVFIADCIGFDLYFLDKGRYAITNAVVISSAQNSLSTTGRADGDCRLTMENVFLRRLNKPHEAPIAGHSTVTARHCTFEDLTFKVTGAADLQNCLINGAPVPDANATGADLAAILATFSDDMRKLAAAHGIAASGERVAPSSHP